MNARMFLPLQSESSQHSGSFVDVGSTVSLTKRAFVTGEFAGRTGAIKLHTADTTHFILWDIPVPSGNGIPLLKNDLHGVCRLQVASGKTEAIRMFINHVSTSPHSTLAQ